MTPLALASIVDDGDLIAARSKRGCLPPSLTRRVTHSPYTHTATVLRLDGMPWVAEMNVGGNHLVPFHRYAGAAIDVIGFPGDRALVRACTLESLNGPIRYDLVDLVRIALWNLLHFKLPRTDKGGMICSAYSAQLWLGAGVRLDLPALPTPADVVREALEIGAPLLYRLGA